MILEFGSSLYHEHWTGTFGRMRFFTKICFSTCGLGSSLWPDHFMSFKFASTPKTIWREPWPFKSFRHSSRSGMHKNCFPRIVIGTCFFNKYFHLFLLRFFDTWNMSELLSRRINHNFAICSSFGDPPDKILNSTCIFVRIPLYVFSWKSSTRLHHVTVVTIWKTSFFLLYRVK